MEQGEATKLWNQIKIRLNQREDIDPARMNAFFSSLIPRVLSDTEFVLSTPNSMAQRWVERTYKPLIQDTLFDISGRDCEVRIVITEETSNIEHQTFEYHKGLLNEDSSLVSEVFAESPFFDDEKKSEPSSYGSGVRITTASSSDTLILDSNKDMRTFDSFVVGDSNKLAFGAARAVSRESWF